MLSTLQGSLFYILPILAILGLVVTVHEGGHFLVAKWLGTAIDRFSIGFGKPILAWRDKAGVEWRIGWMPLGGYVKFSGDDNAASVPDGEDLEILRREVVRTHGPEALSRYFHFKPLWQRALIVAAGPAANFIFSIAIFAALLMALGEPVSPVRIDGLKPGGPAERAGFQRGDLVVEAAGQRLKNFADLQNIVFLRTGTPIDFTVDRGGETVTVVATPERGVIVDRMGREHRLGVLGIEYQQRFGDVRIERRGPLEALQGGVARTWDVVATTVRYLGRMFTGRETAEQLSGPLGMAQLSGDITRQTAAISPTAGAFAANIGVTILELAASISVGIGFLNLLPVPVLDGGHLLFYGYEAVARRPLTAKVQAAGYRVGLALVLGLMLFATWNDLQRLRVFNLFGGLFS
ncbi:M50 family metallopeptidase [Phenylobacterium immobile]|uniref:M50 family metallopeptidase n=1 Tax=Phenylobacterium immobile TaxID=21 RepID=UPI000AE5088F|nr:M50 family metallopeptidase [Phenylobacterium immobile]